MFIVTDSRNIKITLLTLLESSLPSLTNILRNSIQWRYRKYKFNLKFIGKRGMQ